MIINVIVADKKARAEKHEPLVCGNSDYVINFAFDAEWDEYQTKTARFIFDDRSHTDVVFDGTQCSVPVLRDTHDVIVGVYAGDLRTTTPAFLHAQRSILCGCGAPADPYPDVYNQIMEKLNAVIAGGSATPEQIEKAIEEYLEKNPIEGVTTEQVQEAVNEALQTAKDNGEFDGEPGENGVSATHAWDGTTLIISSASGTSSANLKGDPGDPGEPGYTPQKGVDYFDGKPGTDGKTPVKGTDYWTASDQQQIVADVLSALPTWTGGAY